MVTPSDIAVLVASGTFLSSALILSLTMFRLMWWEGRRYFGSAGRKNVAHRYKTDQSLCNTNWAMMTSLCSTLMCTAYGTYFMYEYLTYHGNEHKNHHKTLIGDLPFIPDTIAVAFRTIATFLILSYNLWKLNEKYTENDESPVEYYTILCLSFLIIITSIFSFSGIVIDHAFVTEDKTTDNGIGKTHWYFVTNIGGYIIATFIIFWIGRLFYQRLKNCDLEAINEAEIKEISQSETQSHVSLPIPVISKSGENKIDKLSKQVLLSWIQTFFMTIDFIVQASMYMYYFVSWKKKENHYFAFPIQCISFCFVIILINWCIWLSLDFTHKWYKRLCCCHNYVRNSIRKEVKMGKTVTTPSINNNTGIISINQATITSVGYNYNGGQLDHEPKIDLKIGQEYQNLTSTPANQGDCGNNINADGDSQSLLSSESGISINHLSNIH